MRALAITAVAALGLCLACQAKAANRGWSADDGPYYVTPGGYSFYIECGRPRMPYDNAYGPIPGSAYFGPVGYRCIRGTYAYDPFYPPRCRTSFVQTPNGWRRERHCF